MKIRYSLKLIILFLSVSHYNCNKCDQESIIEEFHLSSETLEYTNSVSQVDNLIYIDESNIERSFNISHRTLTKDSIEIRTLIFNDNCSPITKYIIGEKSLHWFLTDQNQYIIFSSQIEVENTPILDSIVVYENLNVFISPSGNYEQQMIFDIVINETQNKISQEYRNENLSEAAFIGDTIIQNQSYKNVYEFTNEYNNSCFFNKSNGLFMITFDNDKIWLIKN